MNIKFENGSEIHTIQGEPTAFSSRRGLTFLSKTAYQCLMEYLNQLVEEDLKGE